MDKVERFKAQLLVRLRWIGWGTAFLLAGLFVWKNIGEITLYWVLGTTTTAAALIYCVLFLLGWYAGTILTFTVDKVKKIEATYREKMTVQRPTGTATPTGEVAPVVAVTAAPPVAQTPPAVAASATPSGPVSGPQEVPAPAPAESGKDAQRVAEHGG